MKDINTRGLPLVAAFCAATTQLHAAPDTKPEIDEVIVTGVRGVERTVASSPTPIDVIGGEKLQDMVGGEQMRDVLSKLVPSFQSMNVASSSWNSVSRPAALRGLSGAHILVLVNGKRRHNSSMIDFNSGSVGRGANPVDLDLIPASAIERIEILRDGAAAQYGSDAVAGVINIILKKNDAGGTVNFTTGQRESYHDQANGEMYSLGGSIGFALPNGGSTTWSLDAKDSEAAVRNDKATGSFYPRLAGNVPDPRENTIDRRGYQGGMPKVRSVYLSQYTEVPLDSVTLYSTATAGIRDAEAGQAYRRVTTTSVIPAIYPDGFTPYYTLDETDYEMSLGGRGETEGQWHWDVSSVYGRNKAEHGSTNSLNASMGAASPTTFETFTSKFDQWTTNLDLTKQFSVFGDMPLQVSYGLEHRYEKFSTLAGEPASYINGGYVFPSGSLAGQPGAVGAQGAIVVMPDEEADADRNVDAGYLELTLDISDRWMASAAARYEHYNDSAGDVYSGKLNTRYELTPDLAVRATISNGFRAPSLSQASFARSSTSFTRNSSGVYVEVQSKLVTVDSTVGRALGADDLDPETSIDYSIGLTWKPLTDLTVTIDAYRIEIDDLIQQTGLLSGAGVNQILTQNGFASGQSVQYFANAINTTTTGVDLVSTYQYSLMEFGSLNFTAGFNYNKNKIRDIADTPAELQGLGLTLFDRTSQGYIVVGTPRTKFIFSADWTYGPLTVGLRETRYGSFELWNNNPAADEHYGARWITDLDVMYKFDGGYKIGIGANNLFNIYPDKTTAANPNGFAPYAGNSPFGHYGAFYYMRLGMDF